jgi:hypothetical protein
VTAAASEDPLQDLTAGFELDSSFEEVETVAAPRSTDRAWMAELPFVHWVARRVDLNGSLRLGSVYSYLDHKVPHGDEVGRSSSYGNLARLDLDGFLQLDVTLPARWKFRAEAFGWYDFAYRIKGRGGYGSAVLDLYEWEFDSGEVYLTGPLHENLEFTIGRRIVNWGRSDTFRVVDVINSLDQKEPGLVDIHELRRPNAMLKLDAVLGSWTGQVLVIPEFRTDRVPPPGSDFVPDRSQLTAALGGLIEPRASQERSDFSGLPGFAMKLDGHFSRWDLSLYGAYVDETSQRLDFVGPEAMPTGLRSEANRIGMLGAAGNLIHGAWLIKFEVAWLSELRVLRFQPGIALPSSDDTNRVDSMLGVEFYGADQLMITLEVVQRHLLNQNKDPFTIQLTPQSRFETALRISRPFLRERLNLTLLGVGFGERLQNGGLVRFSGDYDLDDVWNLEAGILIFIGGPDQAIGAFESNDRLYAQLQVQF